MTTTTRDPLLVSQREVARLLSCSQRTVRTLVEQGRLRPVHVMGRPRYRLEDIQRLARGESS